MKKFMIVTSVSMGLFMGSVSADALKNSLTNIMKKDDSAQMVDLGNINLNAKPKPMKRIIKNRPPQTVVGIVNNHKIIKKDADAYLVQRTQGKITNYDAIPVEQQKMLLQEIGLPYMAYDAAQKELTTLEKETVLNRLWMQKEARNIDVTDDEVRMIYNQLKQQSIDNNSTSIPEFEAIKDRLRMQIIEKKMITKLMKNIEIKVAE